MVTVSFIKKRWKSFSLLGNYFPLEDGKLFLKEEEIVKHLMNGSFQLN